MRIGARHLVGDRYAEGDFPYVARVDGVPVAGRYGPAVAAALRSADEKLGGRDVGQIDEARTREVDAAVVTIIVLIVVLIVALRAGPVAVDAK